MRSVFVSLMLAVVMALMTSAAIAAPTEDEEAEGRELAKKAMTHYNDAEYAEANELFKKARALYPAGQVLRMSGYTLMALERWLEAAALLDRAIATEYKPMVPRDVEHAQDNLAETLKHLVVVEVVSKVPGSEVSIDGEKRVPTPHKQRLLPGEHSVVVSADAHEEVSKQIEVLAGESVTLDLSPTPLETDDPTPVPVPVAPDPEPPPPDDGSAFGWFPGQGIVGLTVGGLGLVAGVVGIGLGGYGTSLRGAVQDNIDSHNQNYDENCTRNRDLCLADIALINRDGQRAQDHQTAGLVLGITGAAMFAVGTTLFLLSDMSPLAPDEEGDAHASCGPTFGGIGCQGAF